MYIGVGLESVIWTVNWLHYLNYEDIPSSSSFFIGLYREHPHVRPSHPTDGVMEFHVFFLFLVRSENVFASNRLSYGLYYRLPRVSPVIWSTLQLWVCVSIRTYDISRSTMSL